MIERWPSNDEVLAVLKARYPQEHKDTVTISYTPGFGGCRTAEEVAEILHKAICQARDAMDVGFNEDIEPQSIASLFAPRSKIKPFNIIELVKAIPEKQHD
jgi:hypothetical protein